MMLKLIIFDMDGLMLDTEHPYRAAYEQACFRLGLPPSEKVFRQITGRGNEAEIEIFRANYPSVDPYILFQETEAIYSTLLPDPPHVMPGLFEVFAVVERRGNIQCAVATSSTEQRARTMLRDCGILPHLAGGVFREDVCYSKPDPEIFLACCAKFGVQPDEALVLEDSDAGVCAAAAGGIPVIVVPNVLEPSPKTLELSLACYDTLEQVAIYFTKGDVTL